MSGATFISDDLVTIVKVLLPSSGGLILPIPSRQSLEQVLAGKILQLLLLFLPVEAVPKLHPGKIELKKVPLGAIFPNKRTTYFATCPQHLGKLRFQILFHREPATQAAQRSWVIHQRSRRWK